MAAAFEHAPLGTRAHVVEHTPPGPVGQAFHDSDAFVRLLVGPVGSGKSVCGFVEILRRTAERQPDADGVTRVRAAVIRNTFGMLRSATLPTIAKWWPDEFGRLTVGTSPIVLQVKLPKLHLHIDMLSLDNEDDVRKLLGTEYHYAWIDEGREIPWAIMQALVSRVGRQDIADRRFAGIWVTSNPSPTEHWLYQKSVSSPEGWAVFLQPGGRDPKAENMQAIGGKIYYDRIVASNDPDFVAVFVDAKWGHVRIGEPVFPQYSDQVHVAKQPLTPISGMPLVLGLDFGISPACVWIQEDAAGRYMVLAELADEAVPGIQHFSQAIQKFTVRCFPDSNVAFGTYDPAGGQRSPLSDQTQADILKALTGYRWAEAKSNLFSVRREALIAPLTRLVQGQPGIIIDPRCVILRRALASGFAFKTVKNAFGQQLTTEPLKNHPDSDVADALCYGVMGAGEYLALVQVGAKKNKHEGQIWNPRLGKWCSVLTGEPIQSNRQAKDTDYNMFG
jgi:hypothetical protein